jgi:drug/metabolite transporter (DMT)-like permease
MIGVGIAAALAAAGLNAGSVVMQSVEDQSMPDSETMHASLFKRLAHRPRWLVGTGLMAFAGVLQVVALSFAGIAIVQPLLATSQLALLGTARWKLRQPIGPHELLSALAIMAGVACVVLSSPHNSLTQASAARLAPPLALVGGLVLIIFAIGRTRHSARLLLVLGAGLAYAWTDFVLKLLSNAASTGRWVLLGVWLVAIIACGAVAFLQETSALQHRPVVTVAPVIGAAKVMLPVLMALWAGIQPWSAHASGIALLIGGLAITATGAAGLGSSSTVARLASGQTPPSERTHRHPVLRIAHR